MMELASVLETLQKFREKLVSTEELLDCTKRFLESLEYLRPYSSNEESCIEVLEAVEACLNSCVSEDAAELFAFEFLGPCLRALSVSPRTCKLYRNLFSLSCCCVSLGKSKELFIVVLDEVINLLRNSPASFFSRVFPVFLLVCNHFLQECKTIFLSDVRSILKVFGIAWNTELPKEIGSVPSSFGKRGRDCDPFLEGSFMNACNLSFSVLNLIKNAIMEQKFDERSSNLRCYLIHVILDLMAWVSVFFTDVSIFGNIREEVDIQQSLWKFGVSLVKLLYDLSVVSSRTRVLGLSLLSDEPVFQDLLMLQPDLFSAGSLAEFMEEIKKEPWSFLSIGCFLFLSLKSSPFEDDCFLDSKYKLDLYLPPIAALFQSKWYSHRAIALWLCQEVVSNTLDCFKGNEEVRLLQTMKYRHYLSENVCSNDCSLLIVTSLLLQCFENTANQSKVPCQVMNSCLYHLSEPFMRWQTIYFCLMTSTVTGVRAHLIHEMKETLLKMENETDAIKAVLATHQLIEKRYDLWYWLADFLFANFLIPRWRFMEDLPLASSAVHILAFVFWRMKRHNNDAIWKRKLESRAKNVRTLLGRILDQISYTNNFSNLNAPLHIPEEMRNRICNESLLCISLLDQTLLSESS